MKDNPIHQITETIFNKLKDFYGEVECPLKFSKDYELAIAIILSAQCTDERVNSVTPELFTRYPSLESLSKANLIDLEEIVFPTGFFRNKAKMIKGFAQKLITEYNSKLPTNINELISLPGLGRKSANVILNEIFGKAEGIVVDTHVKRICNKLGLTQDNNPEEIERQLMEKVDKKYWHRFSLYLIYLGRDKCKAHKQDCNSCPLNSNCPSKELT